MGSLDNIAEERIREAFARGEFEHLSGAGQPLALDDGEMVPPELRWQRATLFETGWAAGGVRCSMSALAGYTNQEEGLFRYRGSDFLARQPVDVRLSCVIAANERPQSPGKNSFKTGKIETRKPAMLNRETIKLYLNVGHSFDHLFMLVFPTVVLAISAEWQRPYSELLPLSLPGFIAFGVFSIPAGWLADRWSRSGMMTLFFFGIGGASVLTGFAQNEWQISACLGLVGMFAAIYHPVGMAILVANEPKVGRTLGVNGVYGNTGLALAALISGALADLWHWRAAFFVPGILCIATGIGFALAARGGDPVRAKPKAGAARLPRSVLVRVFVVVVVSTICGGVIFNATTVAMPKIFDERLTALTQSTLGIGLLVCVVYLIAAMAQLLVGWWLDRRSLKAVFVPVVALQVPLLFAAGSLQGYAMLACAVAMMFFVFGQIPINDAMIARYTSDEWRARAYSVRYVLSFAASATAVPLIAGLYKATGDFALLFNILAALAVCIFFAALSFPSPRAVKPAAT